MVMHQVHLWEAAPRAAAEWVFPAASSPNSDLLTHQWPSPTLTESESHPVAERVGIYVTLFVVTNVGGESGKLRAQLKICILPSDILGCFFSRVVDRRLSRPPTGIKASSLRMTCLIKLTPMICFIGLEIQTSTHQHKRITNRKPKSLQTGN